jgi:hypothetical protein
MKLLDNNGRVHRPDSGEEENETNAALPSSSASLSCRCSSTVEGEQDDDA